MDGPGLAFSAPPCEPRSTTIGMLLLDSPSLLTVVVRIGTLFIDHLNITMEIGTSLLLLAVMTTFNALHGMHALAVNILSLTANYNWRT